MYKKGGLFRYRNGISQQPVHRCSFMIHVNIILNVKFTWIIFGYNNHRLGYVSPFSAVQLCIIKTSRKNENYLLPLLNKLMILLYGKRATAPH
jgi:hypothetical protein